MKSAPLIVIEGVDRIGKNTQAERLVDTLRQRGTEVEMFSTPEYSEDINGLISQFLKRKVWLSSRVRTAQPCTDDQVVLQCLQMCNRYAVADDVSRATGDGKVAVVVRWWQSAHVYGKHDGLDEHWIRRVCSHLPRANLNILLRASPEAVRSRCSESDRYEACRGDQLSLAEAYDRLWREKIDLDPEASWKIVDGSGGVEEVARQILWEVDNFFAVRALLSGQVSS